MSLIKWTPIRDLIDIQEEMNKLFNERLDNLSVTKNLKANMWEPLVDIIENDENYIIKAEVPDVEKKDIVINVENNLLSIKGEKKIEKQEKKENYHRAERYYGVFERAFTLPSTVDQENIKASLEKGVLTLIIPKKEELKPKKIDIDIK